MVVLFALSAVAEPLTLEQALETAQAQVPEVAASLARSDGASARADLSRAALLPRVSAGVGTGVKDGAVGTSASARADIPLWDGSSWASWAASRAGERAAEADTAWVWQVVVLDVRLRYYDALAAEALSLVATDAVGNAQAHLDQVAAFIEVESRPEIDRAQAQTDLANARFQQIQTETNAAISRASLARAIGRERADFTLVDVAAVPVVGEDGDLDALIAAAEGRPDLTAARERLDSAEGAARAARSLALPTFDGAVFVDTSVPGAAPQPSVGASVGASWAPIQGGGLAARSELANADVALAEADLDALRRDVSLDVEIAWRGVTSGKAALVAAEDAVAAARARLKLAQGRYLEGAGNAVEESDARLAVTRAEAQRIGATYDLAAARARLEWALGR